MDVRRHPHELDRLTSLRSYPALDARPAADLDAITRVAARLFRTPRASVTLVEEFRELFVSRQGFAATDRPRTESVCSDVVAAGAPLVVADLSRVPRYSGLPWVGGSDGARAYAGVPIVGRDGLPLGTLCVLDTRPRRFDAAQVAGLVDLARQVATVLELHRADAGQGLLSPLLVPEARDPEILRRALEDGEFVPHFQPLVDMRDGVVTGFEGLIRWQHPTRGLLTPDAFLPGLSIGALDGWHGRSMILATVALLVDLRTRGIVLPDGIAINLSTQQMVRPGVAQRVLGILAAHALPADSIVAEITEHTAVTDVDLARRELAEFRAAGARVVADDFGVGWSNLTRLLQFSMSGLKIDRELVTGMVGDRVREQMVTSAIDLAETMGLDVVAEGVETPAVRDRLLELGCIRGQGWLFGRAVPAADVPALLGGRRLGLPATTAA